MAPPQGSKDLTLKYTWKLLKIFLKPQAHSTGHPFICIRGIVQEFTLNGFDNYVLLFTIEILMRVFLALSQRSHFLHLK